MTRHRVLLGLLGPDWVNDASTWLQAIEAEFGLAADDRYRIELCAEELTTNVVKYGDAQCAGQRVELHALIEDRRVRLTQIDPCAAFDPLSIAPPPVAHSVTELQVGGQGIHLVRSFSDGCLYERRAGCNRVELVFELTRPPALASTGAQTKRGVERRRAEGTGPEIAPEIAPGAADR